MEVRAPKSSQGLDFLKNVGKKLIKQHNHVFDQEKLVRNELQHHANSELVAMRVAHKNPNKVSGEEADSIEPTIPKGSIVIVDLGEREP